MPRFLAVLVLFVVGWAPVSGIALGLGDIDLKSALNQPFVAEISVSTDSEHDIAALEVDIAPVATFEQYGLDRAAFLEDFEFDIVANGANGIVRITSVNPVVEPFVTLLLEISWPQGRLLREYTVLLDPPVFAAQAVAPVVEAPKAGPAPGPTRVVRPATPPAVRPATQPVAAPAPRPATPVGDAYGPVQRNDTLWGIAGRYADAAGVNRNQMMLAIYRANPEAFVGNINRLKAGMILRVPDAGELQRLSGNEAGAEVRRQNQEWRGAVGADAADAGTLRLVPPPDAADDATPTGAGAAADSGTADAATSELGDRVNELEEELAESRRLLELRDQELQALQQQLGSGDQELIPGVGEEPLVDEPVIEQPLVDEPVIEEPVAAEPPPPAVTSPAVVTTPPAAEPSFISGLLTNVWLYVGLGALLIVALFIVRRRSVEPDEPAWSRFDDDGALGEETAEATQQLVPTPVVDETFVVEESLAESTDQEQAPYMPEPAGIGEPDFATDQDVPETPLERTISTESPVNLDEADPIAEADFHMAYGLYDQAADLLSNSLSAEPDRTDLRVKLLEVYFIWENQGGFLREAQELQSRIDDPADPDWNKVLIMGKQICPDEELFAASPSVPGGATEMDFTLADDSDEAGGDSIDFDFSATSADVDVVLDDDSGGLDFELSAEDLGVAGAEDEGLDFDISEAEEATLMDAEDDYNEGPTMETPTMESPIAPPSSETTMETPTIESAALDSDATMESPIEPPSGETTMETPTVESAALETTMETPTIESPIGSGWEQDAVPADQTAEIELDDLGLDLSDLEAATDAGQSIAAEAGEAEDAAESDDEKLAAETLQLEAESLDTFDDTQQHQSLASDDDAARDELADLVDVEATGEMPAPALGDTSEQPVFGDTVEQPEIGGIGDTAEQPVIAAAGEAVAEALIEPGETSAEVDFEVGDTFTDGDDTTNVIPPSPTVGDGATMTEVGTKLDLARAYIDMGDPDGARSILNEVLEEAIDDQRQEAQKLLDDLDD